VVAFVIWVSLMLVPLFSEIIARASPWFVFGRLRQQAEEAWEDPGERVLPAEPRLRKSRKGPRK
jgi:hypothetical protein